MAFTVHDVLMSFSAVKKIDAFIPVAGKAVYFAFAGVRAKMLGRTYVDLLNFLHYEFTLPESEETWKKRQDLLVQLSEIFENRMENSVLPKDFVERVKAIIPDIVGAAASERTTLSAQAFRCLSNIAKHLETQLQSQLDILLPNLIAICGSTKSVNQKNANECIINLCKHAGYNTRLFYHVCSAFRDRRVPPRTYAPEWLRILIDNYRSQMDLEKDGAAAQKAIYEGLTDGQVKVRENSRATYWTFHSYDVRGARMIIGGLNSHAQAALRADPNNPDKTAAKAAAVPRPKSALASIRAQNKEKLQQQQQQHEHRGFTPASIQSDQFKFFGGMDDLDHVSERDKRLQQKSQKTTTEPAKEKQDKPTKESSHGHHQSESSSGSRPGTGKESRPTTLKVSKDNRLDTANDHKGSSPQIDARPLLSAPVRRGRIVATPMSTVSNPPPQARQRIVATPMAAGSQRPESRGDHSKKASVEIKKDRMTPVQTSSIVPEASLAEGKENMDIVPEAPPKPKPEGKENTIVIRPRKKRSPNTSPRRSPNRSPQRSPHRDSIASAKKSLSTGMEFLRHGTLDALGYRRLRKLIENHPGVLITRQAQFNELFELLITNMTSFDEIAESREKRTLNLNHPAYNRHTILITLIDLFQQYPQWPEPQPGMTLCALLIARCNHSSGYASALQAIDDSAFLLCSYTQNPLPTIDAVLDTLEQIEHIVTTNDPIVTPQSTTTIFYNSLQSLASDFGPERSRFATRLPLIMDFGLKVLNALLVRLVACNQTLFTIQEDRLASFAEHLLATYTSLIKRGVMNYCISLHAVIKPEKRFYNYFSKESDKNLIHYYVAGAQEE